MRQLFCTLFFDSEWPILKVGEQVPSRKLLHNDIDEVLVLENV